MEYPDFEYNNEDIIESLIENNRKISPEKSLLLAMLTLTIQDLGLTKYFKELKEHYVILPSSKLKKDTIEDAVIFLIDETESYLYSFNNVCRLLNLDPDLVRGQIIKCILKEKESYAFTVYSREG